ncbi:MAG: biotin transporter BioY [Hydrotalea sp.]|nr:biotin transporter BioY [Hydrotalea sp.]
MKNEKHISKIAIGKNPATLVTLLKIIGGVALVYAASNITIPLQPVPVTLQTFAVLLLALTYSRGESLASILAYVGVGAMGAPVFAGGAGGPSALLGATGGYIVGFVLAVAAIGWLKDGMLKQKIDSNKFIEKIGATLLLAMVGLVAIFAPGILWLANFVGFEKSIALGLMPFILPEMVKAIFLALSLQAVGFFKK